MKYSVAMVFRNELEFLDGWFKSVLTYADEILCGAHNPTDGSLEYVEQMKKLHPEIPISVKTFPEDTLYRMGFSFMKNVVAADATGDWIVSLDADEEMDLTKDTLEQICKGNHIAISTQTMHISERQPHWSLNNREQIKNEAPWIAQRHWRIYKNFQGISWWGMIHEELRTRAGNHVSSRCLASNVKMWHFGALHNPEKRKSKPGLYAELLLRIVENPSLRKGTNSWWFTKYFEEHKEELYKQREEYRNSGAL